MMWVRIFEDSINDKSRTLTEVYCFQFLYSIHLLFVPIREMTMFLVPDEDWIWTISYSCTINMIAGYALWRQTQRVCRRT